MVSSMTGYGRAQEEKNGLDITVEIKSVNSRYFEYTSRMPRSFLFLDDKLKKEVNAKVARGKVELCLTIVDLNAQEVAVHANIPLAQQYLQAMREMGKQLQLSDDITLSKMMRLPDVFTTTRAHQDEEQLWQDIKEVTAQAVRAFICMRNMEGEKLKDDIEQRLKTLEQYVILIEKNSEVRVKAYTDRLYERLKNVLQDRTIDEARLLTEAAIFADKTAVDEETVRLHSHIKQYREILQMNEPIGRKLDFLTQELNREVNTIGSKCSDLEITRAVVEMKGEIEKIREQVQNIE